MELMLETKIESDDDNIEIVIESWLGDYRIRFRSNSQNIYMPLATFDEVAAIIAKFREANLILTGGKDDVSISQ